MNESYLVTKSNDLIEARHKHPLSAREQKIILTMVSMIQISDEDFMTYDISVRDFHELLGLEGREKYTELKDIIESLMAKVIEIPTKDGGWLLTHWVSVAQYIEGEGIIKLKFVPELKPYLLQLKKAFTSYRLSNILSLKSAYSIRMYELMKKWQHLGKLGVPVKDLKEKLGVKKGKYKQYGHLKSRVLNPAIKELNDKTDIQVSFKEIRKSRKVIKIEFLIKHYNEKEIKIKKSKTDQFDKELFDELNDLADGYELSLEGFKHMESVAKKIYTKDEYINQLELLVETANLRFKQGNANNPVGLMIHIINDKEKLFEQGYEAKVEETSSEIIPEWLKKQKSPKEEKEGRTPEQLAEDVERLLNTR
ncbi:replication initiation protein [Halobacillus seohaensis]|uniref:Replication initiation protein n=1 Tax=Halobacillus seohaensis TaxID=447421 RepID=A0ABW2EPL1_9BACI